MKTLVILIILAAAASHGEVPVAPKGVPDTTRSAGYITQAEQLARSMFPRYWVDLVHRPCSVAFVNYRRALAAEVIAPTTVRIGDTVIGNGIRDSVLIRRLGRNFRIVDSVAARNSDESNLYFSDLMQAHRNTLHYYELLGLRDMQGWFQALEWRFPDWGTITAYLTAAAKRGPYHVYLLHVRCDPIPAEDISLSNDRGGFRATRKGSPQVIWDIRANVVGVTPR